MGIAAGTLNRQVTLWTREAMPAIGTVRGGYTELGWEWGAYKPRSATEFRIGGMQFSAETGVVTLRDNPLVREISLHDRLGFDGKTFEVLTGQLGEPGEGTLRFDVRTAVTAQSYEDQLNGPRAQIVKVSRVTSGGTVVGRARAIVAGYQPEEIAGGIQYGEKRVLLSAQDLIALNWPVPPRANDKILQHGDTRQLNILSVDDETHRIGGEVLLYEIRASG